MNVPEDRLTTANDYVLCEVSRNNIHSVQRRLRLIVDLELQQTTTAKCIHVATKIVTNCSRLHLKYTIKLYTVYNVVKMCTFSIKVLRIVICFNCNEMME